MLVYLLTSVRTPEICSPSIRNLGFHRMLLEMVHYSMKWVEKFP